MNNMETWPKRPRLLSLIGTYIKPEMHSVYRQVTNISTFEHVVATERLENVDRFPFEPIVQLDKIPGSRKNGRPQKPENFSLNEYLKYRVEKRKYKLLRKAKSVISQLDQYHQFDPIREWIADTYPFGVGEFLRPEIINEAKVFYSNYNLKDVVSKSRPDLVHVYFGNKATSYYPQLVELGVPWIVSFHGADISKNMESTVYTEQFGIMLKSATLVTARSEKLLEQLESYGCGKEKLRLNRTSIPLDEIPYYEKTTPINGEWVLIQACRLLPKKGLLTAIEAFREVVKQFPKAKFFICGTGPLSGELQLRVDELGLNSSVIMTGRLDHEQLYDLYRRAHIFLHPSETMPDGDQEGVPNAILEAMATGLPFVSTYHGGIPEVLKDGQGGHLVGEKSPHELAHALVRLMTDHEHYLDCASQVRDIVEERFCASKNIMALESIYQEALEIGARSIEKKRPNGRAGFFRL